VKRPLSHTIIAWLSILAGAVCFLALLFLSLYAESGSSSASWFHRFEGIGGFIAGAVASLSGGVLVLKRSPWGRWLVLASIVLLQVDPIEMRTMVIVRLGLMLMVCGYFLFRPQADAYFRGGEHDPSARLS
jgi:hypothetical protein